MAAFNNIHGTLHFPNSSEYPFHKHEPDNSLTARPCRFMALEKATSRTKFYQILHQAMVELLILKDMKKPLADGCNILGYEEAILSIINQAEVKMNDSTTPSLTFHGEEAKTAIYEWFAQLYEPIEGSAEAEAERTTVVAESSETQDITPEEEAQLAAAEQDEVDTNGPTTYRPKNLDFLRIPLTDPEFKFAVSSLISIQLTSYIGPHMKDFPLSPSSPFFPFLVLSTLNTEDLALTKPHKNSTSNESAN